MRQERKVVTVLFCDLVGFTSRAEEMDPEDVAALLAPYQARLKDELERYGGTVEKFIGDAVMALFGAPTAHEDDPERAVRAALAIRSFAEEEGIELRIGITTGEALVSLDRKSTRLNSSHGYISYAVFCLKKKDLALHFMYVQVVVPQVYSRISLLSYLLASLLF